MRTLHGQTQHRDKHKMIYTEQDVKTMLVKLKLKEGKGAVIITIRQRKATSSYTTHKTSENKYIVLHTVDFLRCQNYACKIEMKGWIRAITTTIRQKKFVHYTKHMEGQIYRS